jgi:oligo-alginate lyase
MLNFSKLLIVSFLIFSCTKQVSQTVSNDNSEHPKLILTKKGVENIRKNLGKIPIFDNTLQAVKDEIDAEIALGIKTPIPLDYSGGYTHTRHKKNFLALQKAGLLYQILDDEKYAKYVKDMLMQYEEMYKTLPLHPNKILCKR